MTTKAPSPTNRSIAALFLLLIVAISGGVAHASDAPATALVKFAAGVPESLRAAIHAAVGAVVVRHLDVIDYDLVSPTGPLEQVLDAYRTTGLVAVAEENAGGHIALSPGDACTGDPCTGLAGQWHHRMTNTPFGWDAFPSRTFSATEKRAANPVTIAVLDTKIDQTHPDWINAGGSSPDARDGGQLDLADARDWVSGNALTGSAAYHGTFVAGLAGAATGNDRDAAGVGYAARIMPLTVVNGSGNTDAASLAEAIVYAWQRGARVINLSLGITADSRAVHDAIRTVTTAIPASLVVAAAGNNIGSVPFYPGSYPESMSVSGTDAGDHHAGCANYNANVSVSAPADRLIGLMPMPAERGQAPCGTSAAAPQVSGLAALLFMQDPSRTPADVRRLIEQSADDLGAPGRDDYFGSGRINVERALRQGGPGATGARSTTVAASGGRASITAIASASTLVRGASVAFDRPGAAPVAMQPTDGSFDAPVERMSATLQIPSGLTAGPHPIWVRTFDGTQWGAATVGVIAVDGRAPTVTGTTATNALRATGESVVVSFKAIDDYSNTVSYGIEFRSTATGAIVFTGTRMNVATGAQTYRWKPGLDANGGHLKIKIVVIDEAHNAATVEAGTIVT